MLLTCPLVNNQPDICELAEYQNRRYEIASPKMRTDNKKSIVSYRMLCVYEWLN